MSVFSTMAERGVFKDSRFCTGSKDYLAKVAHPLSWLGVCWCQHLARADAHRNHPGNVYNHCLRDDRELTIPNANRHGRHWRGCLVRYG
jgi:hypothetical protein